MRRTTQNNQFIPILALLYGATTWGLIWYPYRVLAEQQVSGSYSTLMTYLGALVLLALVHPKSLGEFRTHWRALVPVGLAAGWCNLSYVLAMLDGQVMTVLLLFYLAPLWTVPLARLVLNERVGAVGYGVIGVAFAGAVVMLWNPASGLPLPSTLPEWLGLSAGFTFALSNVLTRRAQTTVEGKAMAVFIGGVTVAAAAIGVGAGALTPEFSASAVLWMLGIAAILVTMGIAVQYGITHTPATQAIVIMLFELIVAAVSSYFLAGESMSSQEWIGGAMIIAASLFSGQVDASKPAPA